MIVDLIKTTTTDGLRLDGALHQPSHGPSNPLIVDAVVCLPGAGGNFYGSELFEGITPGLLDLGLVVLWANTRGHDGVSASSGKRQRQGVAYESVDECRFDVRAWVNFLVDRGFERVGLFGHSLGAIKAIYAQAHQPHSAVGCIVAASPPRLSYSAFKNGEQSPLFFQTITMAEKYVREGRPDHLMDARFPFPLLITAENYADKYGRQERYNILKFVDRIDCPMLFAYGQIELQRGGISFAGMPEALRSRPSATQQWEITTVPHADHFYTNTAGMLSEEIVNWLSKVSCEEQ